MSSVILIKAFKRVIALSIPFFLYYFGYNYYLIATEKFWDKIDAGSIYRSIEKSKLKTDKKKIIFTDSVGGQIFSNSEKYDSLYVMSLTAPSSLVGLYILLQNLLENKNLENKTIYYIAHPSSLVYELREPYTYNHFVKPFFKYENFNHISKLGDSILSNTIPFLWASQLPFVQVSNWQPNYQFTKKQEIKISDLYIEYFKKIVVLSKIEDFNFFVVMPFLNEKEKKTNYTLMKKQIKEHDLEKIFSGYFENTMYLSPTFFRQNDIHYKSKALNSKLIESYSNQMLGFKVK